MLIVVSGNPKALRVLTYVHRTPCGHIGCSLFKESPQKNSKQAVRKFAHACSIYLCEIIHTVTLANFCDDRSWGGAWQGSNFAIFHCD